MAWVIFPAASLLLVSAISETAARFEAWLIGVLGLWQIEDLWRWLAGQTVNFGAVDVLVNNAGIGGARLAHPIVCSF